MDRPWGGRAMGGRQARSSKSGSQRLLCGSMINYTADCCGLLDGSSGVILSCGLYIWWPVDFTYV